MKTFLAWLVLAIFGGIFTLYFVAGMTDGFKALRNLWATRTLFDIAAVVVACSAFIWALACVL